MTGAVTDTSNPTLHGGAIRSAGKILTRVEDDVKLLPAILGQDPSVDHIPKSWRGNMVRCAQVVKLWRAEGRQTLVLHPEVVRECSKATSAKIPTDVLRTIPYLNPMVVFPEPIEMPTWRDKAHKATNPACECGSCRWDKKTGKRLMPYSKEETLRLLGFFCFGHHDTDKWVEELKRNGVPAALTHAQALQLFVRQPSLTHDADAERFGILAFCEVVNKKGEIVDWEISTMSVGFGEKLTMNEMAEQQLDRYQFCDNGNSEKAERDFVKAIFKHVIGSLMYLASTTLDAEKVPASVTKGLAKRTLARKPLSMHRIGWTVGGALSRMRSQRLRSDNPSQMVGPAHEQDPQHRKAHFKVVWTGPGRSIPKTAYVAPYWTHRERLGLEGVNTVRKVI